jgi:Ig-like domain from next to BRCA1 gene
MKKSFLAFVLLTALVACNLPGSSSSTPTAQAPDAVFTQMAQTVAAELTKVAQEATPTSSIPTNTLTPVPTNTPLPTVTNTPIPCNMAEFVTDVTVPDNTVMAPSQAFTKTWRLKNIGTCSWNSSYQLFFDHGDAMGVANTFAQPLTTGTVSPGQAVDVSVNLTAPAVTGTYTGYWRFRDSSNIPFGLGGAGSPWLVKIKVVATTTVTLLPVLAESGTVDSAGTVSLASAMMGVGDDISNRASQMFISFNISGIPTTATITEVKLDMRNSTISGDPFAGLSVLNLFKQDYITLEASDFVAAFPSGGNLADWGSATALNTLEASAELKALLQSKLGTSRLQLRFQFVNGTDNDGVLDAVIYLPTGSVFNNPALIVTYTTP